MANIMITGASGWIGRELTGSMLRRNHKVFAVDSKPNDIIGTDPNYEFTQCDITDEARIAAIMQSNHIDLLAHLACTVDNDLEPVITDKEIKTSKVVDKYLYTAAKNAGVGCVVVVSTTQVYGIQKGREPIRETIPTKGNTYYCDLKMYSEKMIEKALKKSDTEAVVLRTAPLYDAEHTDNLRTRVYDPKENVGYIYREGEYGFSFCCVYNLVDFIKAIVKTPEKKHSGTFNIADTTVTTAKEIIDYEKERRRLGAVIQKQVSKVLSVNKSNMKSDYRYFEPNMTFFNWYIDTTKAKQMCALKWNFNKKSK